MISDEADQQRRRRYQIRRSQVQAAAKRGTSIEPGRMSDTALWAVLQDALEDAVRAARCGTNVEAYLRADKALVIALELRERGSQLGLGF